MAKRLNKNLVVGLTLTGMLVITVVAVWMLKNLRDEDPGMYVTQAEEYAQDGKPTLALKAYLRAHRAADRKEPQYLILAGDMAMEAEDSENALKLWSTAINLDPQSLDAQRKIVEFRLEQARIARSAGMWALLRNQAQRLLTLDDSLALGHNALGLALINTAELDPEFETQGEESLKRALELAPDDPDYVTDLARHYGRTERLDQAEALYVSFLEAHPDSARGAMRYAEFRQFRAQVLLNQGATDECRKELGEAKALLTKALESHPDDPHLYMAMGAYWEGARIRLMRGYGEKTDPEGHTREQLLETIRSELETAIELDPDAYPPYLALGQLYRTQQPPQREEALQVYKARYDRPASRSGFKGMLNRYNQFRLCVQIVETLLDGYVTREPTRKDKKHNEGIIQEAEKYLALAVSERGENETTYRLRGKIRRRQNKTREAINEMEKSKAAAQRPDLETLLLLGELYSKDGQLGVAYRSVKDALAIRGDFPPAWALLSQIQLALDQPQYALESAEQALKHDPQHTHARLLRAQALVKLGRQDEVGEELSKLITEEDTDRALPQEALILELEGREEEALIRVLKVLENSPTDREAVRMAVVYYQENQQTDRAIEVISRALQKDPQDRGFRAIKVNLEIEDPVERDAKLIEIIGQGKNPVNRAIQLFNFHVARGNIEEAREALDQAEELDPRSSVVAERQFRIALLLDDFERAEEYVAKGARLNVDGAQGEFFRGRLLLARVEYQRAIEVLRNAINTYPSNSHAYVYLGLALQATRHNEEAGEAFETALEYDPTNGQAHLGMAKIAYGRRDEETLHKHLDACAKHLPNHPWVQEQLQLRLEKEDPEAGIAKRQEIRREKPEDRDNLLRLANLYAQTHKFDQAVEVGNELNKSDPTTDETWYVSQIYSRAGRAAEAESMLKKTVAEAEDNLQKAAAQLYLAQHYRNLIETPQDSALVEEAYLQAAAYADHWNVCYRIARWYHDNGTALNDREQLAKALDWYERANERAEQVANNATVTRYRFDALIAAREYEQAAQEIETYIANYPNDLRGLLYKGEVELQLGRIQNALAAFESFLEKSPRNAMGYFRRGTVYYARSEWDKAIADLTQAKALAPDDFHYVPRMRLATALEKRNDVEQAIAELQGLINELSPEERTSQDALSVTILLSEILGRNGRLEAQRALATQYKNLRPYDPSWYTVLGQNALAMDNVHQAFRHLREACSLSNYAEPPVDVLMTAWIQSRDYDQAINFMINEVPEDRRGGRAHLRWAQALVAKEDRQAAMPHFVTALEMSAGNPELSSVVAQIMIGSLGTDGAIDFARERIKTKPDDRTAKVMVASLLGLTPEGRSEALEIWRSLVASAEDGTQRIVPLTQGAQIAYVLKDFDTAKDYYQRLIAFYDDLYARTKDRLVQLSVPGVLNNLAYMLAEDLNQPELALPHIQRAVDLASDRSALLDTLGWVQVKLGRYREAIGTLSRALEKNPDIADYHLHIAEAYAREGVDLGFAGREFQRAYELALKANNTALKQQIEKRVVELNLELMPPTEAP